jgi:hypothetical protein
MVNLADQLIMHKILQVKNPIQSFSFSSMLGCRGAYPGTYTEWVKDNGGQLPHELSYPYMNTNPKLKCPTNVTNFNFGAKVTQVYTDGFCSEEKLMKLVSHE